MNSKDKNPASEIKIGLTRDKEMDTLDKTYSSKKQKKVTQKSKGTEKPFILIGFIIVVLIFATLFFLPGVGKKSDENKIEILGKKIAAIEKKLSVNGNITGRISFLERQQEKIDDSINDIEKQIAKLSSKIIRTTGNIDLLLSASKKNRSTWKVSTKKKDSKKVKTSNSNRIKKKKVETVSKTRKKKKEISKKKKEISKKVTEKKPKVRYHIVKKGDTLYNISRRYNLTVTQLQSINKLKKDKVIVLGQKLLVIK